MQQFASIVGITVVLNLQPLPVVERCEQQRDLILELIQLGDLRVVEVGWLKNKPLRHIAALPQSVENQQIAHEETVG